MFLDFLVQNFSKINKNGINTILILAVIALVVSFFSNFFGSILFFITLFSLYFFRDPERITSREDSSGVIFAPADGIVTSISTIKLPKKFVLESEGLYEGKEMIKVSIFLNIFDVHVNRSPVNGEIKKIIYTPGKFVNVAKEKESDDNENNTLIIKSENNNDMIIVTQIAGLIARRIVCQKKQDDNVASGERFGIIKFGSRVNIYMPADYKIVVKTGQRMIGGETIMGFENFDKLDNFILKNQKKIDK
jgi:phosphatidylserine decarboxylase